jgi:CRISPR-associated endonuclease/helicase Cas3
MCIRDSLDTAGAIEMVQGDFPVLRNLASYRKDVGICIEGGDVWRAEDLIC